MWLVSPQLRYQPKVPVAVIGTDMGSVVHVDIDVGIAVFGGDTGIAV
jgi:hypothetical protein